MSVWGRGHFVYALVKNVRNDPTTKLRVPRLRQQRAPRTSFAAPPATPSVCESTPSPTCTRIDPVPDWIVRFSPSLIVCDLEAGPIWGCEQSLNSRTIHTAM